MDKMERSAEKIETAVWSMQRTLWRMAGAVAVLVLVLSIFGQKIAEALFGG